MVCAPQNLVCLVEGFINADALLAGFGAVMGDSWLAGSWSEKNKPENLSFLSSWIPGPQIHVSFRNNVNYLELVTACLPVLVWSQLFRNIEVVILSDNSSMVCFINRGTTANLHALKWLKSIFYAGYSFDFFCLCQAYPGSY